jgi:hypothetical protein
LCGATGPTFTTRVAITVSPGVVTKSTAIEYCRGSLAALRTTPCNVQPSVALPVQPVAATSGRALCAGEYVGTATVVDEPPDLAAVDDVGALFCESDELEHPAKTTAAAITANAQPERRRRRRRIDVMVLSLSPRPASA